MTDFQGQMEPTHSKTKKRAAIIIGSLIVMIIVSGVLILLERPSTGTIINNSSSSSLTQEADARRINRMSAAHFTLEYDAGLDTLSNVTSKNPGSTEAYRVAGDQRVLAVTVKQGNSISEESSYRLRQTQPNQYKESKVTHGNLSFTLMKKTDGSEITSFIIGQGRYVVIAYTMQDPLGNIQRETDTILKSFRWL